MHFVFYALWAVILTIGILQKSLTDPVTYQKYEIVRDTLCYPCTWLQSPKSPHFPGWGTWFHPNRWTKRGITTPAAVIGTSRRLTEQELLYKLGGNGPWIQRVTPGSPDNRPPPSCRVEQVHMVRSYITNFGEIL
jgi:acid phosphatase